MINFLKTTKTLYIQNKIYLILGLNFKKKDVRSIFYKRKIKINSFISKKKNKKIFIVSFCD